MARIAMVTRTIQTTKVNALCVNLDEKNTFDKEFILSGTYKDDKALMKALEKVGNDEHTKVVDIHSSEVIETLYGMSEQDFISTAKVLPPRGTKAPEKEEKTTPKKK